MPDCFQIGRTLGSAFACLQPIADGTFDLAGFRMVVRQQFGSQKIRRSRSSGAPLDLGFDLKGASTDALKKCASLLGVGLYLSRKEASRPMANHH